MNPKSEVVVLLFIIGLAAGCSLFLDNEDHYHPVEEKYKIKFKQGDILTYLDQNGVKFQMKIISIGSLNRSVSRKGSGGPYDIYENQTVEYDSLLPNPRFPSPLSTASTKQPLGTVSWNGKMSAQIYSYTPSSSKLINQVNVNSVYTFSRNTWPANSNDIVTWYYCYEYGFVGFDLAGGQSFSLELP